MCAKVGGDVGYQTSKTVRLLQKLCLMQSACTRLVPYKTHRQKLYASDPNGRLASYNSLIFHRHFQNPGRITVWVTRLVVEGV